jgi:hypothetical protein
VAETRAVDADATALKTAPHVGAEPLTSRHQNRLHALIA